MKLSTRTVAGVIIASLILSGAAIAQQQGKGMKMQGKGAMQPNCPMMDNNKQKDQKGMPPAQSRMRMYDPAKEETFKGVITKVGKMQPKRQMPNAKGYGIMLTVKTDKGNQEVMAGPSWYYDQQKVTFKKGDKVEITAAKMSRGDKEFMIAGQITKGKKTLKLRNDDGTPVWRGQGPMGKDGKGGMGMMQGQGKGGKGMMMKGRGQGKGMQMQNCPPSK